MSALLDCPDVDCWQALLAVSLPPDEQERCERHLEACASCQQRLDRTQDSDDSLLRLARHVGDPTTLPAEPALVEVLERLHEVKSALTPFMTAPADLYFLRPAAQPGLLGILGSYEVSAVIGQGGMGVVLKAFDPALHRLVAIKVMAAAIAGSALARQRFHREAQAAAAVCHEHIVTVHGVHESDGLPYLVMQYVPGESLQARLERTGPLAVVEIVRIGLQTASGLAAAHAQGLIHRDIKPANLLLEQGLERVKITDFGLARMTDDVQLTQHGVVAGTPEYMAPEQARGEPVDHRADLFSLGSVLYALCTGVPPFRAASAVAVLRQVSDQTPAPIRSLNPDIPAWLETFIARLLAKEAAERLQSAAEVAALLEGYLAHLRQPATVPAPEVPGAPSDKRFEPLGVEAPTRAVPWFPQRLWMPALALTVLLLVALGIAMLLYIPRDDGQPKQAQAGGQAKPAPAHVAFDFRTGIDHYPALSLNGPDWETVAKTDSQGLRVTIPPGQKDTHPILVELAHCIRGDFDIALGYELIAVGQPVPQYGAGVALRVRFDSPSSLTANLSRRRKPFGERFGAGKAILGPDGKDQYLNSMDVKATGSKGKLRFVRNGSQLHYLVAEEGQDFKTLQTVEIGTDDVQAVYADCFTMSTPIALDVRLTELVIDADQFPNGMPSAQVPASPVEATGAPGSNGRLAVVLLGLGIVLAFVSALGLGGWLYFRHRRGGEPISAPGSVEDTPAKVVAAPPVAFSCTACGKSLKAKAELAGKKVKCSQCGQPVLVPGTKTNEAGRSLYCLLAALGLAAFLMAQNPLPSQQDPPAKQPPPTEVYQDFRNSQPLQPSLKLMKPGVDTTIEPEDEGLRIKLPPTRDVHYPAGIATTFSLSGDFEITTTYQLLAASRPTKGYGVGVSLSVATDPERHTFAKVGRFQRVKEGSVYAVEFWTNGPPKDYQFRSEPTEVQTGKLRLAREGATMHFLVADAPGNQFREIYQRKFGTEDLAHVHLEVVDSGNPGNTVDVRLIDLKIRSGRLMPDEASNPALFSEQAPPVESRRWLVAAELFGLVCGLAVVFALGVWLYLRQSHRAQTILAASAGSKATGDAASVVSFPCSTCGKSLRAKAELAGKKVKCSQCSTAVLVPDNQDS